MPGGQLKEVRGRIKSVISTQQITKAMKMVSAAKLRRAQDAIIQMRPYSKKLQDILSNIVASQEGALEIKYAVEKPVKNVLIVLITSDKGLCGGFNSNLIKQARYLVEEKYKANTGNIHFLCIGKKGYAVFRKYPVKMITDYVELFSALNFEKASKAAELAMNGFEKGDFDKVEIVYGQFKNAATQIYTVEQFLPIARIESGKSKGEKNTKADFIYEPNETEIVEYLIPKILKTQFYKALLDSNASEHGARMTAMDKATDNASELLRDLKISYNRARQAAITTELTEIVSGAAALESE